MHQKMGVKCQMAVMLRKLVELTLRDSEKTEILEGPAVARGPVS